MNRPAKVLYVHHGSGRGGAANSLLYLLQNLDRSRFEAQVACNFRWPGTQEFFSEHGFPPVDLPVAPFLHMSDTWRLTTLKGIAKFCQWLMWRRRPAQVAFHRLLQKTKWDLVHLNGLSIVPLAQTAKRLGVPVVQHVRESVNDGTFGIRKRWLTHLVLEHTDHVIYICVDGQDRLTGPVPQSSVVYNPVDLRRYGAVSPQCARRKIGILEDQVVLFFPGGSMFDIKGIIPFLNSLAIVRDTYRNICAVIPGLDAAPHPRDAVRREVEQIIATKNLQRAVMRLPFTTQVEEYYAASDIVVSPFLRPHFSRAVIEAGAMARPVIGSSIGGITEVLEDGKVGLLATPGDHEDLAKKICYLIEHREIALDMGQAGRIIAQKQFNATDHAKSVMDVYDHVLRFSEMAG